MKICSRCQQHFQIEARFCPWDGAPLGLVDREDELIGKTLAQRYRLISRLGSGGASSVYLARHVMIARLSAVKVLKPELAHQGTQRDRFLREARAVNRVNHECIVEISDFGEAAGLLYLVMEYVPGESLASTLLREKKLPWLRVAAIGAQIAAALARAHQMGVVHRDLKPGNILLLAKAADEEAKLTDFGIAKIADAPPLTGSLQVFGTPGYIAPESIEGGEINARTDIYSLGVLLYQCLAGKLPYSSEGPLSEMLQRVSIPPMSLSQQSEQLPEELERLITAMLQPRPANRPRDAFLVFDRLAALLISAGVGNVGPITLVRNSNLPTPASFPKRSGSNHRTPSRSFAAVERPFAELSQLCDSGLKKVRAEAEKPNRSLPPSADWALQQAAVLSREVQLASKAIEADQAQIAGFEQAGRQMRSTMGAALDELGRDLSRVRQERSELLRDSGTGAIEITAVSTRYVNKEDRKEDDRLRAAEDDIAYQIHTLQEQLRKRSEHGEARLEEARSELEGKVAALRRLAAEAWGLINEVAVALEMEVLAPSGGKPSGELSASLACYLAFSHQLFTASISRATADSTNERINGLMSRGRSL